MVRLKRSVGSSAWPVSANPPADLPGKSARLWNRRTHLSLRMAKRCGRWAGHLCPDENLLRQNASI
ncbi:hypothetical protein FFR93_27135 [Rhizobium sp. MHM7A]|nr:hypothetical protein FFR93_27135 [Rhizobium sp. MHM7A]